MPKRYIQGYMELSSSSRKPFQKDYDHLVMIELETTVELFSRSTDDGQVLLSGELERILNKNLVYGSILDAHIAQNEEQRLIMWERREAAAEISLLKKPLINNDIAVPLDKISEFLTNSLIFFSSKIRFFFIHHVFSSKIVFFRQKTRFLNFAIEACPISLTWRNYA